MGKSQQRRLDEAVMRFRRESRGLRVYVRKSDVDLEKVNKKNKNDGNSKTQRKSSRFA